MKQFKLGLRGQIFSTDLIVASTVFLLILTFSIVFSSDTANKISLSEKNNLREQAAITAASALVYSAGSPVNWETLADISGVTSIGLADSRNEIGKQKLQKIKEFSQSNYETVKDLLGLSRYGLKVEVLDMQNNQTITEFGQEPGPEQETSTVNRFAGFDEKEVIVRVKVFEQ